MGELIARAHDSEQDARRASIAVCSYVDEFASWVIAALRRERALTKPTGTPPDEKPPERYAEVRRELVNAAYNRLAIETRAIRPKPTFNAEDVAAITRHH